MRLVDTIDDRFVTKVEGYGANFHQQLTWFWDRRLRLTQLQVVQAEIV
jgi:hypothetical protein